VGEVKRKYKGNLEGNCPIDGTKLTRNHFVGMGNGIVGAMWNNWWHFQLEEANSDLRQNANEEGKMRPKAI